MKITELEKILEQLLEDKAIIATKSKSILINNMLAICRNVSGLHNIINSISERDGYVDDVMLMVKEFASDFSSATVKKLMAVGIDVIDDYDDTRSSKTRRIVISNDTPYTPFDPMMGGYFAPAPQYMQQPMFSSYQPYPQQQFAPYPNQPYPQQPMQQPQYAQPAPPPAPAPAPVAPPPPPPAPASAPTPAPAVEEDSAPASSSSSSAPASFDLGGFGGGNDKPAAGRDFLLSLLNK